MTEIIAAKMNFFVLYKTTKAMQENTKPKVAGIRFIPPPKKLANTITANEIVVKIRMFFVTLYLASIKFKLILFL